MCKEPVSGYRTAEATAWREGKVVVRGRDGMEGWCGWWELSV